MRWWNGWLICKHGCAQEEKSLTKSLRQARTFYYEKRLLDYFKFGSTIFGEVVFVNWLFASTSFGNEAFAADAL